LEFFMKSFKIIYNHKSMTKYTYDYPRPSVTVDMIVTRNVSSGLEILLIQRLNPPFKDHWALPGGFIDMDETLEQAAARELAEETGLTDIDLKQCKAYSEPGRDPRGHTISVVFRGHVNNNAKAVAGDDAKNANWFNIKKLPTLAFDHQEIVEETLL